MRIIILTQEDNLYLPTSLAYVCRELKRDITCIVSLPVMSTHGGPFRGFMRHISFFGLSTTAIFALRVLKTKLGSLRRSCDGEGSFYAIAQVARAFQIPFRRVARLNTAAFHKILDEFQPDLLVSLSCPQIINKKIRDRLPKGCINVHSSCLPKYRGLMPAFWVLRNGEARTAVTVHDVEAKLDDGDILIQREVEIAPEETWDSLVRKTKGIGAEALVEAVRRIESGTVTRRPNVQDQATYFSFPAAADRRAFLAQGRRFF